MTAIEVSLARDDDATAVRELVAANADPFDVDMELARRYARVWVARRDTQILGVALTWEVADEIHIIDVLVAAAARRQGLGRALLREILEQAARGPFRLALLEVRRDNQPARGLYESLGFVVVGEREKYYADGEDAVLMRRALSPADP
ncbi:MAG: ribosomal protein S18-alanine N-acetyltransferase [Myxococcota bacterium]